jgi:DNA-binding transcriptional MerR regulator
VSDREGKYRIHHVAERTGIPAATLRAWERRYGLPDPGRTESSYRLYSERDVAMISRVRELCDGGLSPSEASKVVLEEAQTWVEDPANDADPYGKVSQALIRAVVDFDPQQLAHATRHATTLGPATTVTDRVLVPVMREVGRLWHAGEISVAQEHLATQVLSDAVNAMLGLIERVDAKRVVLFACFADEEHSFALASVAMHVASWGHRVVRLGARTPPPAIGHAVQRLQPHLVALSVTITPPRHRARELVAGYAQACGETPWVVGGAASLDLADIVVKHGGHILGELASPGLRGTLERLMAGRGRKRRGKG